MAKCEAEQQENTRYLSLPSPVNPIDTEKEQVYKRGLEEHRRRPRVRELLRKKAIPGEAVRRKQTESRSSSREQPRPTPRSPHRHSGKRASAVP